MILIYAHCRLWVRNAGLWNGDPMRFEKDEIPAHVTEVLEKFKTSKIYFYTSNPFTPIDKIPGARRHANMGVDFGMFKTGFTEIYESNMPELDDVCIMNCGCFILNENWHKVMNWLNYDFSGITYNYTHNPQHIQSYFMIFNRKIVKDTRFKDYWLNTVSYDWNKAQAIHEGECKLTELLRGWGYKMGYYCRFNGMRGQWGDPACLKTNPPVLKILQNENIYNKRYAGLQNR
jgi:lipopolysaccharide biosynthesis protein